MPEERRSALHRVFDREPATPEDSVGRSSALEVLIAVVLGVAAVLTAYAAYIKDGLMDDPLPEATEEWE